MTKRDYLIAAIAVIAANAVVIIVQFVVSCWKWRATVGIVFPEARYHIQSAVLLLPFVAILALRWRYGRKLLTVVLATLMVHAGIYMAKAHIPGSRRNQYISACDWAVDVIQRDYNGPSVDREPYFTDLEYHPLARPVVDAHVARVAYLLGGRAASFAGGGTTDVPDYIVDEPHRVNRDWWYCASYDKLAERKFGKSNFAIFKRVK